MIYLAATLFAIISFIFLIGVDLVVNLWIYLSFINLLIFLYLLNTYKNNPTALICLFFLITYYLGPLPYMLWGISIVPYVEFVDDISFTNTILLMTLFSVGLVFFSKINFYINNISINISVYNGYIIFYWVLLLIYIYINFSGVQIVNIGVNNFNEYQNNLNNQSGALEYFLILMVIGLMLSEAKTNKIVFNLFSIYYIYFCFICGYRIMMLEMILLVAITSFKKYLSFRNIFIASLSGVFLMQAHDALKLGGVFSENIFSLFQNGEIRTNQTEVFYTSNVIINSVISDFIPVGQRLYSLLLAFMAIFIPPGFLPSNDWHPTLSVVNSTGVTVGGGGLMPAHFFYWLSLPGIILCSYITSFIFYISNLKVKSYWYYLGVLLIATSPRWLVYEPVALLFRTGFYFTLIYLLIKYIMYFYQYKR
jgi:hypothetical protein